MLLNSFFLFFYYYKKFLFEMTNLESIQDYYLKYFFYRKSVTTGV